MHFSLVVAFWAVSILFVLTPGADWAYAITAGVKRHSLGAAVAGMLTGHLTATLVVAAGVAAMLAASPSTLTALTVAGAAYLVWLGIGTLRHPATPDTAGDAPPASRSRQFAKGLGISLLNPKVFLLFLALLPQFTTPESSMPIGWQMLVLGIVHLANCALVYFAVGVGAGFVLGRRPGAARVVSTISGVVMIGLGLFLIVEELAS